MYRSVVSRNTFSVLKRRLPLLSRSTGKNLVRRVYSSSSQGNASYQSNQLLNWSLSAAAVLSAIYFISPYEKKPTKKAEEEVKEPNVEPPAADQDESQDETEDESQDESKDEPQDESKDESPAAQQDQSEKQNDIAEESSASEGKSEDLQEPSKENTITSTETHKPEKSIKTDEELQALEEAQLSPTDKEAQQEGAYNPDTGEINWDCPCLGGMAQGPCGEEFKAAFSCFVYSESEPKGIDCVEKFQMMQDCFRKYPDYYADQIKDEEEAASANVSDTPASSSADATKGKATEKAQLVPAGEEQEGNQSSGNSSSKEDVESALKAPSKEESTETGAKENSE